MTIGTNTSHKEVDATVALNLLFVASAFSSQVGGIAVEDIGVFGLDVDVAKEVVPHEGVVAFGVLLRQTNVLVHVEGHYILEGDQSFLIQFNQLAVHAQGRRARGATQYERLLGRSVRGIDLGSYIVSGPLGYGLIIRLNN